MIDIAKKYKTRDGREVRIYAVDGAGPYSVHGAVKSDGRWCGSAWMPNGSYFNSGEIDLMDMIEVRPRIQREVWVNVFRHDDGAEFFEACESKANADLIASDARIACVKVIIDCEEGEGL
jgi:hypothetical protein